MQKYAKPLGALNPFGAVRLTLPPGDHSLTLKQARALHRHLDWAIKAHERDYAKFVRRLTKTNPYRKLLRGGIFNPQPEIRGVK